MKDCRLSLDNQTKLCTEMLYDILQEEGGRGEGERQRE